VLSFTINPGGKEFSGFLKPARLFKFINPVKNKVEGPVIKTLIGGYKG
jgi:hypothetical protein